MGETIVSQILAGGTGLGLVIIAIRQLWPILELNRQAALDWKLERTELHGRIDQLEVRVTEAERKAGVASEESRAAATRAAECEQREQGLRQELADLRGQFEDN